MAPHVWLPVTYSKLSDLFTKNYLRQHISSLSRLSNAGRMFKMIEIKYGEASTTAYQCIIFVQQQKNVNYYYSLHGQNEKKNLAGSFKIMMWTTSMCQLKIYHFKMFMPHSIFAWRIWLLNSHTHWHSELRWENCCFVNFQEKNPKNLIIKMIIIST